MTLNDIKNNDLLIHRIRKLIESGNVSHAYIFEASKGVDKKLLADSFAKAIFCENQKGTGCNSCISCVKITNENHVDVIYAERDGTSVKDEAIETLQEKLKKKPFEGDRNIAIIEDADTMTTRAQNRLLKTLEEPFAGTIIILLAENAESLAETILSRCAMMRWEPFFIEDDGELLKESESILKTLLDGESFYVSSQKIANFFESRDEAYRLIDCMQMLCGKYLRENFYSKAMLSSAVMGIEEARQDLRRGMNVGYSLKSMIIKIGGTNGKSSRDSF